MRKQQEMNFPHLQFFNPLTLNCSGLISPVFSRFLPFSPVFFRSLPFSPVLYRSPPFSPVLSRFLPFSPLLSRSLFSPNHFPFVVGMSTAFSCAFYPLFRKGLTTFEKVSWYKFVRTFLSPSIHVDSKFALTENVII